MLQFAPSSGLHANIYVYNKPDWFVCGEIFAIMFSVKRIKMSVLSAYVH